MEVMGWELGFRVRIRSARVDLPGLQSKANLSLNKPRHTTSMHTDATNMIKALPNKYTALCELDEEIKARDASAIGPDELLSYIARMTEFDEAVNSFKKLLGAIVDIGSQYS